MHLEILKLETLIISTAASLDLCSSKYWLSLKPVGGIACSKSSFILYDSLISKRHMSVTFNVTTYRELSGSLSSPEDS